MERLWGQQRIELLIKKLGGEKVVDVSVFREVIYITRTKKL